MDNPSIADALSAFLRRAVALAIGALVTWFARRANIVIDADTSQAGIIFATALVAGLYGTVVNFLELRFPWIGWFLGLARAPKYAKTGRRRAR